MTNAGIDRIGVVTKYNYQSLMDHLGNPIEWDLSRKDGGLVFIPPYAYGKGEVYRGKLQALSNAMTFLQRCREDYLILSDCNILSSPDLLDVLREHLSSGADVTCVCTPCTSDDRYLSALVLDADARGQITGLYCDYVAREGQWIGTGMYIVSRVYLMDVVRHCVAKGFSRFEQEFLLRGYNTDTVKLNMYAYRGVVLRNMDTISYYHNNLSLKEERIRSGLFRPEMPIFTKVRDEVATLYLEGCDIEGCTVADGCELAGTARDSVLFRGVRLMAGAKLDRCVVMQDCVIEEGAELTCCILDKNCRITAGTRLNGGENNPMIIRKGETV